MIEDLTAPPRQKRSDRDLIRQMFERVVAPRVRDRLLVDPDAVQLDGARRVVTVLYAGIPEFVDYSQQAPPDIVFEVLNGYLELAVESILEEEGTLERFAGDGVMALWNAPVSQPDHALRAVRAALSMDQAVKAHRSLLDYTYHLYFSVGVATGEAALGSIGTRQPPSYTAVGDTVDLARRLGSLAKPGQVLLSLAAFRTVADRVIARELPSTFWEQQPPLAPAYELLSDVF